MPVELSEFLDRVKALDLASISIAIAVIAAALAVVTIMVQVLLAIVRAARRAIVGHRYGLRLPRRVRVKRRWGGRDVNDFQLVSPRWRYAKRDGTRDHRRRENELVRPLSTLNLGAHRLRARDPLLVYNLVLQAREVGHDVAWSHAETAKARAMFEHAQIRQAQVSASELHAEFASRPAGFERFCADLFTKYGYQATVTPPSRDGGYDIELSRRGLRYLVECKCYQPSSTIGRPTLQRLSGANATVGADKLFFVTTARFSADATAYAHQVGMHLVDGNQLVRMVRRVGGLSAVVAQLDGAPLTREELLASYPADVRR